MGRRRAPMRNPPSRTRSRTVTAGIAPAVLAELASVARAQSEGSSGQEGVRAAAEGSASEEPAPLDLAALKADPGDVEAQLAHALWEAHAGRLASALAHLDAISAEAGV